jgi:hypothetical protein
LNTLRGEPGDNPDLHPTDAEKPLPLRYLLTKPVLISVANYAALALLSMVASALMPLIWSTPIEFGGLDMSPAPIGVWLSVYGCMNGLFQFAIFPRAVARFGPRWVFVTGVGVFAVVYAMFPFENLLRRTTADGGPVWLLIFVQLAALSISEMSYSECLDFAAINPSGRAPALITHGGIPRRGVHVSELRRAQQAIARRDEWLRTVGCLGPAHGRASRRRLAFRVLHREQCSGWELGVCRASRFGLWWAVRRGAAPAAYVGA